MEESIIIVTYEDECERLLFSKNVRCNRHKNEINYCVPPTTVCTSHLLGNFLSVIHVE